mgnify:CR=1 FL=1
MLPQSTFDKLSCMVMTTDSEGRIKLVTDGFLQHTGYTRDQLFGHFMQDITKTDLDTINLGNDTSDLYLELIDVEGNVLGTIVCMTVDSDTNTTLWSFVDISVGSYMDKVHELSRREAEVFTLRSEIENISTYSPIGLWRCNIDGNITWVNDRFSTLFHVPKRACLGDGWLEHLDGDKQFYQKSWRKKMGGQTLTFDVPIITPNGKNWLRLSGNRAGVLEAGYVGTVRDITHERDLLPQLENLKY